MKNKRGRPKKIKLAEVPVEQIEYNDGRKLKSDVCEKCKLELWGNSGLPGIRIGIGISFKEFTHGYCKCEKDLITASIKIGGKMFTSQGKTITEVLGNLQIENIKGRGILTLEKGDARKEKILGPMMIPRLFGHFGSIRKEIAMKQLCAMFDKSIFE